MSNAEVFPVFPLLTSGATGEKGVGTEVTRWEKEV
jgi:hypothetical protein